MFCNVMVEIIAPITRKFLERYSSTMNTIKLPFHKLNEFDKQKFALQFWWEKFGGWHWIVVGKVWWFYIWIFGEKV